MIAIPSIADRIHSRMTQLRMTNKSLAARSGVSLSTLNRVLENPEDAKLSTLRAIANAVGMTLDVTVVDGQMSPAEFKRQQAMKKARQLAEIVQGTSALEAQGVEKTQFDELVDKTYHELMTGSPRRLWAP